MPRGAFSTGIKPIEAARNARAVVTLLKSNEPLPPSLNHWLTFALEKKLASPSDELDRLLGFKSRRGGRGHHHGSEQPARDQQLRELASSIGGTLTAQAQELNRMRVAKDPRLESVPGRVPGLRQLIRILGRDDI